MCNKVQVIFTAECNEKEMLPIMGLKFIPTTLSVRVEASGLEEKNNSPEQLFGKILMKEASVIAQVVHKQVCDVMRQHGVIIVGMETTEPTINKEQTH